MATCYAVHLGKKPTNEKKKLSMQWQFHGREARVSIGSYFKELELILEKHDLKDKHYLIYNIDVKGIY